MSFPPDLFLIGAMKAGTTSLAELLSQHPDVCLSSPKETHYFTEKSDQSLEWYKARFSNPERSICIDASTSYSIAPIQSDIPFKRVCERYRSIPQKIAELNPQARFIYILREPVARTYSHYNHNARDGWEKRPFMQAIHEDAQYLSASHYLHQLQIYWAVFPKDSILIIPFEGLMHDPVATTKQCLKFMGLDTLISLNLSRPKNAGFLYNPIGIGLSNLGVMKTVSKLMPTQLKSILAPLVSKKIPAISPDDKVKLAEYFSPHNDALQAATGFDVSNWRLKY